MSDMNDFFAFQSTQAEQEAEGGVEGLGCSGVVAGVAIFAAIVFIVSSTGGDALKSFLGMGALAYLIHTVCDIEGKDKRDQHQINPAGSDRCYYANQAQNDGDPQ